MTDSTQKTVIVEAQDPCKGIYEDVQRQLSSLVLRTRKVTWPLKQQAAIFNTWILRSSPEGSTPAVKVTSAGLGMTGSAVNKRHGLDVFQFEVGGKTQTSVKIAIALDPAEHTKLRTVLVGIFEKFVKEFDPMVKSRWYEKTFSETLNDGTKVFRGTSALQSPSEYLDMTFTGDDSWDSPSSTFGPFMFGADTDQGPKWYVKPKVSEDAYVYLYNNKKGGSEMNRTSEEGQVVYPRGGVPVKNTNMLNTLLNSKLYKEKMWRATAIVKVTGISLKTAQSGTTPEGNPVYSVYPSFSFSIPTAIILVEHDMDGEDESRLSDKQRDAATRAVLFEGMVAPKTKRRAREAQIAPIFNGSSKKHKAVSVQDSEEDADSDGEDN